MADTGPSEVKRPDADYEMNETEDNAEVDIEEKEEEHVEEEGHEEDSVKGAWITIHFNFTKNVTTNKLFTNNIIYLDAEAAAREAEMRAEREEDEKERERQRKEKEEMFKQREQLKAST